MPVTLLSALKYSNFAFSAELISVSWYFLTLVNKDEWELSMADYNIDAQSCSKPANIVLDDTIDFFWRSKARFLRLRNILRHRSQLLRLPESESPRLFRIVEEPVLDSM